MELARINSLRGETSEGGEDNKYWRAIWWLNVPGFVKHFMWKACYNILPIKKNLDKKSVIQNPSCPICISEEETIVHALWSCPAASDVWGITSTLMRKWSTMAINWWSLWQKMVDNLTTLELEMNTIIENRYGPYANLYVF